MGINENFQDKSFSTFLGIGNLGEGWGVGLEVFVLGLHDKVLVVGSLQGWGCCEKSPDTGAPAGCKRDPALASAES